MLSIRYLFLHLLPLIVRVARHAMPSIIATILIVPTSVQAEKESCSAYWGESVEVAVSIAFQSTPPHGLEFFAFNKPRLLGEANAEPADYYEARRYDVAGKVLTAVFCGVRPAAVMNGVNIAIGPHRVMIPAAKMIIAKSAPTKRTKVVATHSEPPLELNWVSPIKLSFNSQDQAMQEVIVILFATPDKMSVEIGALDIRLMTNLRSCRALSGLPQIRRTAKISATVGSDSTPRVFNGIYYSSFECGPRTSLDINLGEAKLTERHQISIQISRLIELGNVIDPTRIESFCNEWRDAIECIELRRAPGTVTFAPAQAVEIKAKDSNVFPKVFSKRTRDTNYEIEYRGVVP
jgi:hypothetical protein